MKRNGKKSDVYQMVTDRILEGLDKGTVPWRRPWVGGVAAAPINYKSKKPYRGINIILLAMAGYECPYWMTFNQVKGMGGSVNKGEQSTMVVLWKPFYKKVEVEDPETGEMVVAEERRFMLRYYNVFNLEQTTLADRWERPVVDGTPKTPHEVFTSYVESEGITVNYGGGQAYYSPLSDSIAMPRPETFPEEAEFHSTAYHEAVHSTGHKSRLDRFDNPFDEVLEDVASGESYSKEELVAEIGAAILCNLTGVDTEKAFDNSVAYINGWRKRISEDPRLVVTAAARSQKAVDLIMGDEEDEDN